MAFALQRLRLAALRGITVVHVLRNGPRSRASLVGPSLSAHPHLALPIRAAFTRSNKD